MRSVKEIMDGMGLKPKATGFRVEVVEYATQKVVKTLKAESERMAERLDSGVNRNLDHTRFYTRIKEEARHAER